MPCAVFGSPRFAMVHTLPSQAVVCDSIYRVEMYLKKFKSKFYIFFAESVFKNGTVVYGSAVKKEPERRKSALRSRHESLSGVITFGVKL